MSAIAPPSPKTPIRHSKMGRWRAVVLIGVHVVAAIHIWHWKSTGSTITPVEPSEAMQTLELGYVNAGFIFFALAILSTLIFGRWFCGWGCHVVALQDLCGAALKKIGIRPKPIRSRLLVWVPVFAALYMFVLPQIVRIWEARPAPAWVAHLTTSDFWATFPNWQIALLTFFVCGFLIVYVLGAKGFCTYGCPYGGIFFNVDRFAKGRIRVTDDCNQCGHCSAVCTSNVKVADEVNLHRMVVDPGCMKCMDCVSVCPTGALFYGFKQRPCRGESLPIVQRNEKAPKEKATHFDFTWPEEFVLALLFAISFYAFRGLYDAIPFLLSLGIASISAFSILIGFRVFYSPQVRFQRTQLKKAGKINPFGLIYVAFVIGFLALIGNSLAVQFAIHEGDRKLSEAMVQAKSGGDAGTESARQAKAAFEQGIEVGWYPVSEYEYKLGTIHQFLGEFNDAKKRFARALELNPNRPNTRLQLAHLFYVDREYSKAVDQFKALTDAKVDLGVQWTEYAQSLVDLGRIKEAIGPLEKAVEIEGAPSMHFMNLGMAHAKAGQSVEAAQWLQEYISREPRDARGYFNLGFVSALRTDFSAAKLNLEKGLRIDPTVASAWSVLARVEAELSNVARCDSAIERSMKLAPLDPAVVADLVEAASISSSTERWRSVAVARSANSGVWSYFASALTRRQGDFKRADELLQIARSIQPNLPAL